MQVAQVEDRITHVVVGSNAPVSFGISDSPEFYNILSDMLYSDKILAVVRETLCNAWDAHIASGKTDIPIEITCNDGIFSVRDHGTGIRKELMQSVYCIYGSSTKTYDERQTGGLGLGCKSPFAYTDHFQVTNHRDDRKTVYRISKSSPELGGRPGLIEIVDVPSAQIGIEVQLRIKETDQHEFIKNIENIARFGDMKAILNGRFLETLEMSHENGSWLLTTRKSNRDSPRIYVRYGNVVYPVPSYKTYAQTYTEILDLISSLQGTTDSYEGLVLILQAPADSISVTPSRESLSMTDYTVASLKKLLEGFIKKQDQIFSSQANGIVNEAINDLFMNGTPFKLLLENHNSIVKHSGPTDVISSPEDIVRRRLRLSFMHIDSNVRRKELTQRLHALKESGLVDRGKVQSFLKALPRSDEFKGQRGLNDRHIPWFHRYIISPLLRALDESGDLSSSRLVVYGKNTTKDSSRFRWQCETVLARPSAFGKAYLTEYMPFLRNLVILAHSRTDLAVRGRFFPQMQHWFGSPEDTLVYICPRKEVEIEKARAFFKARGMNVVDMTRRYPGEVLPERKPLSVRPKKTAKDGYPTLKSLLSEDGTDISLARRKDLDAPRTKKFEYTVRITPNTVRASQVDELKNLDHSILARFIHQYGHKGIIVPNSGLQEKMNNEGAPDFLTWLMRLLHGRLMNNAEVHKLASIRAVNQLKHYDHQRLMQVIANDPVLSRKHKISFRLTPEEELLADLWTSLWRDLRDCSERDRWRELDAYFSTPVTSPAFKALTDRINGSPCVRFLDVYDLAEVLKEPTEAQNKDPDSVVNKARGLIIKALS